MSVEHEHCHEWLDSLSEYVDGDLDESLCTEIQRHLSECENCRIVIDSLRKTIYLVHTTAAPAETPEDVRERLYRRLNLEEFITKK